MTQDDATTRGTDFTISFLDDISIVSILDVQNVTLLLLRHQINNTRCMERISFLDGKSNDRHQTMTQEGAMTTEAWTRWFS